MNPEIYLSNLREKVVDWENQLAILQDDANRNPGSEEEDNQQTVRSLFRQFEGIQSRFDEIEQISPEEFAEERLVINEEVKDFETSLAQARGKIRDV